MRAIVVNLGRLCNNERRSLLWNAMQFGAMDPRLGIHAVRFMLSWQVLRGKFPFPGLLQLGVQAGQALEVRLVASLVYV